MAVEHVIVVRERDKKIVLSVDEITIAWKEKLRWVHEKGYDFEVHFKGGEEDIFYRFDPDAGPAAQSDGIHRSVRGAIEAGSPVVPPRDASLARGNREIIYTQYKYTVKIKDRPDLDPKIVFEIPPDDRRN